MVKKTVLVLSPHTDDGEFGCGATLSRLIDEGNEVYYVAFSDCRESVPDGFAKDVLIHEMRAATTALGIDDDHKRLLDYKVRCFHSRRQDILEDLVKLNREIKPDIVFTPCTNDIHQDHSTVTMEAIRAFKRCTIYGYELPWNLLELPSTAFFEISSDQLDRKIVSLSKYESQRGRAYSSEQYIRALAITRGKRVFVPLSEVFQVIRQIQKL